MSSSARYQQIYTLLSSIHFLVVLKQKYEQLNLITFQILQNIVRTLRYKRILRGKPEHTYHFAILVVKREVYLDLAIQNINSLHFFNPHHSVTLYLDSKLLKAFALKAHKIHYPSQVHRFHFFKDRGQAWTISKVEALIHASKNSRILIDADGIWRANPSINTKKITFLVKSHIFNDNLVEKLLIKQVLKKNEWAAYTHYVTGFVSIPPEFMSAQLAKDCRKITAQILEKKLPYPDVETQNSVRRLAEEIGVSLAVQNHVSKRFIRTLKVTDGPSDKNILQSMYYGCSNKIIG